MKIPLMIMIILIITSNAFPQSKLDKIILRDESILVGEIKRETNEYFELENIETGDIEKVLNLKQ